MKAVTLLSVGGYRRGKEGPDRLPPPEAGPHMEQLWKRYKHLRFFRDYFAGIRPFLLQEQLPTCNAGVQQLNIDHVGNVSPCIEHIDRTVGNVREASIVELHRRLVARAEESRRCQDCWTACRGMAQAVGSGGSPTAFLDMSTRMRST